MLFTPSPMTRLQLGKFIIEHSSIDHDPFILSPQPIVNRSGILFSFRILHSDDPSKVLFQSLPGRSFIQSAVGNDQLSPGNGEYRIIQNNAFPTSHQSIDDIRIQQQSSSSVIIINGKLGINNSSTSILYLLNYEMRLTPFSSNQLRFHVEISSNDSAGVNFKALADSYDRIILSYAALPDEHVFGLGEQFSLWSLQGHRVPILTREQGIGRGLQPITYILNHLPPKNPAYSGADALSTYTAIPHYITSHSRSLFLLNSELSFFDFKSSNQTQVEVTSRSMKGGLLFGSRPLDLIREYTDTVSGRMKELPDWVTGKDGAVVGIQGGEDKVYRVVAKLKEMGVPVAAVWLQDWVGMRNQYLDISFPLPFVIPGFPTRSSGTLSIRSTSPQKRLWWNWEYDRHSYPNWPEFVRKLRSEYGVRVMTYINPFLTDVETGNKPAGSFEKNYFREASEKGYLVRKWVKKDDQWVLGDYLVSSGPGLVAGMIDLSNPDAYTWYKSLIKENMLAHGVSGWMADFGEYLPYDAVLHAQLNTTQPPNAPGPNMNPLKDSEQNSPHVLHNLYPLHWARLNKEAIQESRLNRREKDEIVFFMRSASQESPGVASAFWNGDQMHTWDHLDGLESSIYATLSGSLSGMAFTHSDIGGYTTLNVDPRVTMKVGNRTTTIKVPILERRARYTRNTTELFYRWMETCSLIGTAMFRTHEGSVPDENLQVWQSDDIAKKFGFYTELYRSLFSYRKLLAGENTKFGYPPVRPLYLHFPHQNRAAVEMERLEYMLGPLILVIPITVPGINFLNQTIVDLPDEDETDDDGGEKFWNAVRTASTDISPIHSDNEDEIAPSQEKKLDEAVQHVLKSSELQSKESLLSTDERFSSSQESLPDHLATRSSLHPQLKRHQRVHDSVKGAFIDGVKNWVVDRLSTAATNLVDRLSMKSPDTFHIEHASSVHDKPTRNRRAPPPIVAPSSNPHPHHGRPYLPHGTWIHVWTMTRIRVHDLNGIFISSRPDIAKLPCPVGQPPIFIREIGEELMLDLIQKGMFSNNFMNRAKFKNSMAFSEDWRYWVDPLSSSSNEEGEEGEEVIVASSEQINERIQEKRGDELHSVAMDKYRRFARSLRPFWDFVKKHRVQHKSDGESADEMEQSRLSI